MLWRSALGALIVVAFTATTTAVAGLLQFKQLAKDISGSPAIKQARIVIPQPGNPQTILILGSDHRAGQPLAGSNSDTIILVRLNPDSSTINVLSVPRDLRVQIPHSNGVLETAKINAAYSEGGPNLVVKTLQQNAFPKLQVNHIVDINFRGFKDLVNAIGCVYTDVDRRYYHSNAGLPASLQYSEINIQPGYQKLCDEDALGYVRYRHTDTDIVRSARQQDFIRQAKDQYGQANLISNRDTLLRIFGAHTQTDANLHSANGIENLFNLVAFSDVHAIRETHFPANLLACAPPAPCYVTADPGAEASAYRDFMAVVPASSASPGRGAAGGGGGGAKSPGPQSAAPHAPTAGLQPGLADAKAQATALGNPGMPVYVPNMIAAGLPDRRSPGSPSRRLSDRRRPRQSARTLLRRPGHNMAGRVDPVGRVRDARRGRQATRAPLRRPPAQAGRVAHPARCVLGLEHVDAGPIQPADDRARRVAGPGRALAGSRPDSLSRRS
jgi:LCP family protein required for cell wall assembly